jgi:hypothetical protein
MQKTFEIKLRCSYADRDKYPEIEKSVMRLAAHLYAEANLIADMGSKSIDIAVCTDDNFHPSSEIKRVADVLAQGLKRSPVMEQTPEDEQFTESLLKAFD